MNCEACGWESKELFKCHECNSAVCEDCHFDDGLCGACDVSMSKFVKNRHEI